MKLNLRLKCVDAFNCYHFDGLKINIIQKRLKNTQIIRINYGKWANINLSISFTTLVFYTNGILPFCCQQLFRMKEEKKRISNAFNRVICRISIIFVTLITFLNNFNQAKKMFPSVKRGQAFQTMCFGFFYFFVIGNFFFFS